MQMGSGRGRVWDRIKQSGKWRPKKSEGVGLFQRKLALLLIMRAMFGPLTVQSHFLKDSVQALSEHPPL